MRYITLGDTFDVKFTTRKFSTGAPFTLAGTPAVSAYPDNSTTQLTGGITLSVDFDGVTGLNNVRVVATSGNSYAAGNWALVITTGTVDSVSVVGEVIEQFVIGAAPVDVKTWLGSAPNSLVSGRVDASAGAIAANAITATAIASDAITDAKVASDVTIASVTGAVGSVTGNVGGNVTGSVGSVTGLTASDVGAIKAKTDNLPSSPAAVGSAMTLTSGERNSVADAVLDRDMSTGADNGSATVRTVRQALRFLRNKWTLIAGTLTVYKENDSDASWTSTVSTDAAAEPVTASDPAGP